MQTIRSRHRISLCLCIALIFVSRFGLDVSAAHAAESKKKEPAPPTLPAQFVWAADTVPENKDDKLGLPRLVMKNDDIFAIVSPSGMINVANGPYGLYRDDTRFLSTLDYTIDGAPLKLISADTQHGISGYFIYHNSPADTDGNIASSIELKREIVLADGMFEKLTLRNRLNRPVTLKLGMSYDFDFKDMFEVRGQIRLKRGSTRIDIKQDAPDYLSASYIGLDKKIMKTGVLINASGLADAKGRQPKIKVDEKRAEMIVDLPPEGSRRLEINIVPQEEGDSTRIRQHNFDRALAKAERQYKKWTSDIAQVECDDPAFNDVMAQAVRDLYLLRQKNGNNLAIAAGLPWYAVPFGRDQLITSMQILPFAPDLVRGVLLQLASFQGKRENPFTEETEGKIMHELRSGEMARLSEIPFTPYYGTIDATPLFISVIKRYVDYTHDRDLAQKLWPNIQSALSYLERNTNNVFLYYGGVKGRALANQAWKDSGDSVMHKDGRLARQPIAICEVQGYLYSAWLDGASLAESFGYKERARDLRQKAARLKAEFQKRFWLDKQQYIALAIDGAGDPCEVISSNPGHLLSTGILSQTQQDLVVKRLMANDMYSGWGIRTLSSAEKAYKADSYHNGSVWPHDNALITAGMAASGHKAEADRVIYSLFDLARHARDKRLPELFCGYPRVSSRGPKPYPVSCSPQAWCVGSVFQMLGTTISLLGSESGFCIKSPALPPGVNHLRLRGFWYNQKRYDVEVKRNIDGTITGILTSTINRDTKARGLVTSGQK